jgi:hypothetical protein
VVDYQTTPTPTPFNTTGAVRHTNPAGAARLTSTLAATKPLSSTDTSGWV